MKGETDGVGRKLNHLGWKEGQSHGTEIKAHKPRTNLTPYGNDNTTDAEGTHWASVRLHPVADRNWFQELDAGARFRNSWIGMEGRRDTESSR